jgi:TP901 family phage tail tape measure protein|nr:MAG TPA: minor tail protein [Herelleviridae sp.]
MADKKIRISLDINAELGKVQSKVSQLQQQLNKVQLSGLSGQALVSDFDNIQNRIKKLQELAERPLTVKSDFTKIEKETSSIQIAVERLFKEIEQLQASSNKKKLEFLPNDQKQKIDKANSALSAYEKTVAKTISKTNELKKAEKDLSNIQKELSKEQKKSLTSQSVIETKTTNLENIKKQLKEADKLKQATAEVYEKNRWSTEVTGKKYQSSTKVDVNGQKVALKDITEKVIRLKEEETKLTNDLNNLTTQEKLDGINQKLKTQNEAVEALTVQWKGLDLAEKSKAFETLKETAQQLGISLEGIVSVDDVGTLTNRLQQLEKNGVNAVDIALQQLKTEIKGTTPSLEQISDKVGQVGNEFNLASQRAQEFANLKSQVLSFFTITGAIQLFRRAVQSAFETVKELDEAMTEIAVVSDFSVGDMWKQLPKFTEQANQLGKSIRDVYGATTLYVQQGLDLDNSLKLANETLKMAAVAGMDAKDATDAMTSALRGFNMELSETSAQKVNDVYSELAAISAADTQEISTAMSKVASLAHNVNMEFETTASFLTQGIEATREAPETIGTALKTIIARFAEVKSLYTKGQLSGTDEEGETIDVNKVQTALRSAGISMNAFLKGEEGLDQVLLRLSSRWNDLNVLTQRYIATMASGSRQQSRFIAMMDNYAKTTEFVNSAYNSAGSGQRQFEKTLESLEAKLTKLKNAWDEFAMGLTNNVIIKGAVDTLTVLLTAVNKLIDGLSGGHGLIKSVMTLGAVWGGLKLGGNLMDKVLASEFVQRKVRLKEGDKATVETVRNGNKDKISYVQKGKEMAKSFSDGFQSFKASNRKGGFFLENILGIDTKKNQLGKELDKITEDAIQSISFNNSDIVADLDWQNKMAQQIQELNSQFYKGVITNKEYSESLQKLGVSVQDTTEFLERCSAAQEKTQLNAKKLGTTVTVVGGAFMALAGIFSMLGEEGEKVASTLATIGGVLVAIGQIIPVIAQYGPKILTTITTLASTHPVLAGIVAMVGVLIALLATVNANSPEKKLEKLKETTKKAQEAADEASKAYDELASKRENLDKLNSSLEGLTQGSLEWKKALLEVNNEILNLKSQFPDLEIAIDETTGKMSVSNWEDILKKQQEYLQSAQDNLIMATLEQTKGQLEVDNQEIDANKDLTEEQKKNQKAQKRASYELSNIAQLKALGGGKDNRAVSNFANLALQDKLYRESDSSYYSILEKYKSEGKSEAVTKYNTASKRKARYEELFGIGSAEGKGDTEIQEALANQSAMEKYRNQAEKISKLSSNNQALISAFSGDYTLLPEKMKELLQTTLSEGDKSSLAEALGVTPEQIDAMMATARNEITNGITTLYKPFTDKDLDTNLLDGLGYSIIQSLGKQIGEMTTEGAKEYLKAFNEAVNDTGLQKEEKKRLENYLSSIDLSDAVQVLDAKEFMKNLGMDETQIEKFWATADTAVKPYITSLEQVQSLNERISKLGEVRSLVENGEKTFSSSDKESLVGAGFADSDFLQTGIDEWTYVGKDSNDLLRQINEKVAQIGETIVEGLQESVVAGEKYQPIIEANEELKDDLELLKENGLEGVSLSDDRIREMAEQLKIDTTNLSIEGIANKLIDAINMADNLASNKEAVQSEKLNSASRQYDLTGNFGTFTGSLTDDEQITIMTAQLNKYNGAMEYYEKLKAEAGDTSNNFNLKLADEAVQLFKLQKQYDKTADSIDTYKDALVQGESAGTDYYNALATAKTDLSTLFNVDKNLLSDDFIKQYAQDIYNLAEGGEVGTQAFNNLREALNNLQLVNLQNLIKEAGGEVGELANWIEELEPTLEVKTLLDNSGLVSGLNIMAEQFRNANKDASAELLPIIQALEKISGTKIKLDYEYETKTIGNSQADKEMLSARGWIRQGGGNGMSTWTRVTGIKALNYSSNTTSSSLGGGRLGSRDNGSSSSGSRDNGSSSSGSGSSSSEKKETTWENPYDKLYNLTEKINESLRQREKLEREYDRILERRGSTFRELRKNYNSQLQSLQKEIALQNQLRAGRLAQLNALSSETYKGQDSDGNELIKSFADWGVTRYGSYDPNTGLLKIDWNAIDAVKDENKGGAIEAYISRLEELEGQIEDIDAQIEDFQDKVTELQKEDMQDYLDFEQKVYDAIVNQQQQLIDDYQNLSDKINDSNSKILDSIQRSIDLQRQIRDNTKTEEDLNEKEARLAYLRQDISNGNLMEIKQLEEELGDDRQNYEDSLIDQQLDRLTQQNDDAQTARERQIELMQAQLDYASKNGEFWNQTYELLSTGFSADGKLSQASQLWNLLKKDEGWKGMSKFGKLNWQQEISKAILSASNGYANWNMYKAEKVDKKLTTKNGRKLKYDGKNWKDSKGNIYKGVDYDSTLGGFTYNGMTKAPSKNGSGSSNSSSGTNRANKKISIGSRVRANSNSLIYSDSYGGGGARQYYANDPIYTVIDENNGYYLTRYHKLGAGYTGWFRKQDLTAYKTGGIADFTGPAWLDGTKSNPELILNARDTENFIALKDILSSIMDRKGLQNNTQSVGDMYFNIDINVDELSNDYDVEDLSKKIKQELTDSAMYRNVNLVNFIR